jgi:FtsZ-binding cell division protein ZapB
MKSNSLRGLVLVGSTLFLLSPLCLNAGSVKERQKNQQGRIYQGIETGQLTRREARKLEEEQFHIQRDKQRAWRDGELTRRENRHLRKDQNRASRDIYRQKHDSNVRP